MVDFKPWGGGIDTEAEFRGATGGRERLTATHMVLQPKVCRKIKKI
jgi:hypothetical protein